MNDYTEAPACKMLATNCIICGRPLVDSRSVSMGIGPECAKYMTIDVTGGISESTRKTANEYVFKAALASQTGHIQDVMFYADALEEMGLTILASKARRRFKNVVIRRTDITVKIIGSYYNVKTPFRRGKKEAFINAWRKIPGRRYADGVNLIPVTQKNALWSLLREFFGGKYGSGPKGVFRVPQADKQPMQTSLNLGV